MDIFIWKGFKDNLAAKANLYKIKCCPLLACPIWGSLEEFCGHLLCFSDHAKASWFGVSLDFAPVEEGFQSFAS